MSDSAQNRWIWIIGSCVTFAFIVFVYYLSTIMPQALDRESEHGKLAPHYTFYKELPNQSVTKVRQAIEGTPQKAPTQQNTPPRYLYKDIVLQAGSYRLWQDADRKRAELALLGIDSRITVAKLSDGTKWHRIEIGPFKSAQGLEYARQVLTVNGIDFYQKRGQG